jgi:glycyl-tRNA synthetase alpha chain
MFRWFNDYEQEAGRAFCGKAGFSRLRLCAQCSHTFNQLDAAGAISVSARAAYIGRVRNLAQNIVKLFLEERCKLGFPLMNDRDAARKWVEELTPDN